LRKFGFKIFTNNLNNSPQLIEDVAKYLQENDGAFVELMVVNDTSVDDIQKLKMYFRGAEVRVHAPHNIMGFDTGCAEKELSNRKILATSQMAADILGAATIVVHAGCGKGEKYLAETIRQFRIFDDKRIVVENLPFFASDGAPLHGNTPPEIALIKEQVGCGFCMDFSHAVCAANYAKTDIDVFLQGFADLHPNVYHISDGDVVGVDDLHLHFGEGNFPLDKMINHYTLPDAYVTMETGYGIPSSAQKWIADMEYLRRLEK